MDKLGKLIYNEPSLLYYYKGVVPCPPLQMVDNVLGIQKCSPKSLGKENKLCLDLKVHGSTMVESKSEN